MFQRIYVDNYKCLVNFDLQLQETSLLLGLNGSGKSAVFDVVFALRQLLTGIARVTDRDVFPSETLTRWQDVPRQVIECEVERGESSFTYRIEVEHARSAGRARIVLERLTVEGAPLFEFSMGEVTLYRDNHSKGPTYSADWTESALARVAARPDNTKLTKFVEFMRRILVCGLYPRSFVTEAAGEDALLARDGANFTAWFRHVFQERQDLVPAYVDELKKVVDTFQGMRLEKVGQQTRALMVRLSRDGQTYEVRLDELSDGQRMLLALYALVHITQNQNYSLFLDEPDNYVALPEIQPWLMALQDACGVGIPQAVLSSHHPELIDYLGSGAGVWFERQQGGPTRLRPIGAADGSGLRLSELVARGWA